MNYLAACLALTVLYSCGNAQVKGTDFYQVSGKVKSIKENTHRAIQDLGVWQRNPNDTINLPTLLLFDEDGNITKEQFYSQHNGQMEDRSIFEYKEGTIFRILGYADGKLVKTENILQADPAFKLLKLYSVSRSLPPITQGEDSVRFDNDTLAFEWKNKRVIKAINSRGITSLSEYDKNRNCIKQTELSKNGNIHDVTIFEYLAFDKQGNWTKRVLYSKENPSDHPFITEREIAYY